MIGKHGPEALEGSRRRSRPAFSGRGVAAPGPRGTAAGKRVPCPEL